MSSEYKYTPGYTNDTGEAEITIKLPTGLETKTTEQVDTSSVVAGALKPDTQQVVGQPEPSLFKEPPCEVEIALGFTLNTGNYSSARADVKLRVPCAHGEIDKVYEFTKTWVNDRLAKLGDEMSGAKND